MERAFVLDPLKDLNGSYLKAARNHPQHSPLWIGILNITPDSFSDGGQWEDLSSITQRLDTWDEAGVPIVDVGAESTRPGANPISPEEEWRRLEPVLHLLYDRYSHLPLKPWISIDTRNSETAKQAIELGADIINDVGGLSTPGMLKVLQNSDVQYVLMHSLGIPANPSKTLAAETDPLLALLKWFEEKLNLLSSAGVSTDRIILDPGIGFGKTALQSLEILRNLKRLFDLPHRLLVGHSRKSFLGFLNPGSPDSRDLETIGASLQLAGQGVDLIRVHDPVSHLRAVRAWNSLNRSGP
jgi:dihydropteroate synthase